MVELPLTPRFMAGLLLSMIIIVITSLDLGFLLYNFYYGNIHDYLESINKTVHNTTKRLELCRKGPFIV